MYQLNELLNNLNVDQIKQLMTWLPYALSTGRKADLISEICRCFDGSGIQQLWSQLDDVQKLAVGETLYSRNCFFDSAQFHAKYERLPDFKYKGDPNRYNARPTALALFLHYVEGGYTLPTDLREQLKSFVPEPIPFKLDTVEAVPEAMNGVSVAISRTENDALFDLPVLLRLIGQGQIAVSEKTSLPAASTVKRIAEKLVVGDFYGSESAQGQYDLKVGAIKAFSWPLLLQASGFVQRNGGKLALSKAGIKALSLPPHQVLATIWQKWLKSALFDEFNRIDAIKGQKSNGRVMTAAAPRRGVIGEALSHCPVGAWINVDSLSQFMQATGCTFEITYDSWKLYLCQPQYGSLGYADCHDWSILQFRYLLCFLMEYAATLGMIDIAYTEPYGTRSDFCHLWGADGLEYLSRYDGLLYIRLTTLGAYCLGLIQDYQPTRLPSEIKLSVYPKMFVQVVSGQPSTEEMFMQETWALRETDVMWRLDHQKALLAVESGFDIRELLSFLQTRDNQPLPESVEGFIRNTEKRGRALNVIGTTLFIECIDDETAAAIAAHNETSRVCQRAGDRGLVVRIEHEKAFRAGVKKLNFGIMG